MAEHVENISIQQTDLLRRKDGRLFKSPGPHQLAVPTDYIQHSIFASQTQSTDGITWTSYGTKGIVVSPPGGYLRPRDALLLGTLGQRWLEDGGSGWCEYGERKDDRVVSMSLNECVRAMGYRVSGGKARMDAAAALRRLTTATLTTERRDVDDLTGKPVTLRCDWHILDCNYTRIADDGGTSVRISLETAALLAAGYFTYLAAPIARDLVREDKMACQLWLLLESEALTNGFTYRLLRDPAAPRQKPGQKREQKYIAEVLGISHWQNKRKIKARVDQAIGVIEEYEQGGRYRLRLRTNDKTGVTFLEVEQRTSRKACIAETSR